MNACSIDGVHRADSREYRWDDVTGQFMDQLSETCVLLRRTANNGKRPDGTFAMTNPFNSQHWKIMSKTVIAQVISERPFGEQLLIDDGARDAKVRIRVHGQIG